MYPKQFEKLVDFFRCLPGVGAKTAERYAFYLLDKDPEEINAYSEALKDSLTIKRCQTCFNLAEDTLCPICQDPSRNQKLICVVASAKDVLSIEKTNSYDGVYHVLGGLISTSKGIMPQDLQFESLKNRIEEDTQEIIVATNLTLDGETTALYLNKFLQDKQVLVTRLAQGLPMGGHLDYADELTLIHSFAGRKSIDK
ncbi:MAG: recombination mediator RecR [Erysipelotrichaceae bacterium]|nr:recombination mediator RecR [Erysipelotrichaceae bacterium]